MSCSPFVFISVLVAVCPLSAETVTLTPVKDSDVYAYTSSPTSTTYSLGVNSTPADSVTLHSQKSLVQFNLASLAIPAGELGSAKLRLFVLDTDPTYGSVSPGEVYVYRQGTDWGAITATSPKWTSFSPARFVGTFSVLTTSVNKWVEIDVTSAVLEWLTGTANYGFILQPQADRTTPVLNVNFASMELASSGYAPQLIIARAAAFTTPPVLSIAQSNGQMILEWPIVGSSGWTLQWADDLSSVWKTSNFPATAVNGKWRVTPTTGLARSFFRLMKP